MSSKARRRSKAVQQPLPELPEPILTSVLQYVPLKQRLTCCCLVSKAWAAAAAATSAHLDVHLPRDPNVKPLQSWLESNSQQVASIRLDKSYSRLRCSMQLPCSRLTRMEQLSVAGGFRLLLHTGQANVSTRSTRSRALASCGAAPSASSSAAAGCIALLPQLRQLHLKDCDVPMRHFELLVKLTCLTSLQLVGLELMQSPANHKLAEFGQVDTALSGVLQQLRGLSELTLTDLAPHSWMAAGARGSSPLAHISTMQQLQALSVDSTVGASFDTIVPLLPTGLTALSLRVIDALPAAAQLQEVMRLTGLQRFLLDDAHLDPQILSNWRSLRHLCLDNVTLSSDQPGADAGQHAAAAQAEAWPYSGRHLRALLQAFGQMTQLQHLQLSNVDSVMSPEALQQLQFSSLAASPHLTALQLLVNMGMPLPQFALQEMLPAGKQLPQLRVLQLSGRPAPEESMLVSADIARIAACCVGLQALTLVGCVEEQAVLQPLAGLSSSLTALSTGGEPFGDPAIPVVLQLTGLKALSWRESGNLTLQGLMQLSALQGLTHITCSSYKAAPYYRVVPIGRQLGFKMLEKAGSWGFEADAEAKPGDVSRKLGELLRCYQRSLRRG